MTKLDLPEFTEALSSLAEVFGKSAITAKAMRMWFDMLAEFEAPAVLGYLRNWAKGNGKFPTPNEVWKSLNESSTKRREHVAAAEKKAFAGGAERMAATEYGGAKMSQVRAILSQPKPTPLQHWTAVRNTPGLAPISYAFADRYFNRFAAPVVDRQPGQDDEERAA